MARRAGTQLIEHARRFDQRILLLVSLFEQRIQKTLAHTKRREHDLARLADTEHVFEHERRVGQERPAGGGDYFDIGKRLDVDPVHQAGEFKCLVGADGVAVHDVQRVAGLPHVQPRQRPPRAADRIEGAVLRGFEHRQGAEDLLDELFRLFHGFRRNISQSQAAERPRQPAPGARAADIDQLQRAAAEIADHPVGFMHAGNDAKRRQLRLARAREHVDVRPDGALGEFDKGGAVLGVTASGGGDRQNLFDAHGRAQRAIALERR